VAVLALALGRLLATAETARAQHLALGPAAPGARTVNAGAALAALPAAGALVVALSPAPLALAVALVSIGPLLRAAVTARPVRLARASRVA
jgi:hypothetical protein